MTRLLNIFTGRRRAVIAVGLALLTASVAAWAYWAASGSGSAAGSVGTLAAPSGVTASAAGAGVSVSWSGVTAPGGGAIDGYYVQRYSGSTPSPACESSPTNLLSSGTNSCSDTVAGGAYTYKVTAVWRSWTARSAASNEVEVAQPSVTSTSPSSRGQGAGKQAITIKGANFVNGATASFGAGITVESTTFTSSTELKATVTVEPGAATGARTVSVTNPNGAVGSLAGGFTVNAGPGVEATSPSSGDQGGTQNVLVKGANFVNGATVSFSGSGITINSTTFESAGQLKLNVTIASGASTGGRTVTVTNPDAGVGSLAGGFTVNGAPTVTSTSPSSRGQGASKQVVAIKGTNFESGATSSFGAGITVESTSFVSATELSATVTVESGAATGARTVTVNNPDTTSASLASGFTVNAKPTVESTTPSSRGQGASKQIIAIKGKNFVSGASLAASFGAGITVESTTFTSSTELKATITVESGAATGARTVTVTNGDAGVGSLASAFTVSTKPTVESTSPSSRGQGASKQVITIKGKNFVSGASLAAAFGAGITIESTTFTSSTEVKATVTVESGAATGARTVTVTNGDAGVGSLASGFAVNAAPEVESTSPSSRGQGASKQTITIKGQSFVSGATSNFGAGITVESTTFVSSTELSAKVTVESGAATGARTVTVTNPDQGTDPLPGGFTVNAGPTVQSTSPSSGDQGGTQNVLVTGTNFVSSSAVSISGTGVTINSTTFESETQIKLNVTVAAGATTGGRTVTVTNPDAGVGSLASGYTVNGAPTVTSTSPSSRGQGASKQTVAVKGTNFENGAIASFGAGIAVESTSFTSSTELKAVITVEAGAATGSRTVAVTNPDTTSASLASGFTVNAAPVVESTSPSSRGQGASKQVIAIKGKNFVSGAALSAAFGPGITVESTSFTSSTEVKATISIESGAATGSRTVSLVNGDAGGPGSLVSGFTVNAGPTISTPTKASPINPGHNGTASFTMTGGNFISGLTVTGNGTAIVKKFTRLGATSISVEVEGKGENGGPGSFTVTNPDGGSATSEEGSFKNG
ncbi:MAG TPA: IPT/TIG domain-containing protein [Solirubrobacteraceae bacterium]|nr:IPT/TIG domain-containing protein [Solirubrobacteraceae bacterium]